MKHKSFSLVAHPIEKYAQDTNFSMHARGTLAYCYVCTWQ